MIEKSTENIFTILENLNDNFSVIDIGGASSPFKRADTVIDFVPFEKINLRAAKGPGEIRFSKDTYVSHDICSRTPWPFKDKQFDYSICSHVLEDVRDPLWVCSEIIRISKAGYIEIPSRLYETAFDLELVNLAGASHHRWIIDLDEKKSLRFTFKYMQVHSKIINNNKVTYKKDNPEMYLCLNWENSFDFYENWLNSGKEIFEYYLERNITEKETWEIYRKTNPRGFVVGWLSYLKNTIPFLKKVHARAQSSSHK